VLYGARVEDHPPAVVLVPAAADSPAVVDPGTSAGRSSLARGGGLVAPALTLANLAGYLLAVVASHTLDQNRYGALTALLGALLVASVPALGLQAVTVRAVALRAAHELPGAVERPLLRRSVVAGALLAGAAAAAAPVLAAFLHTGVAGPLWLALGLLPLTVLSTSMGVLQGDERFGLLALLVVAQAASKGVAVVPLLLDDGPADVLAWLAASTAAAAALGVALVWRATRGGGTSRSVALPGVRETAAAATGLVALLALANLDLLLARNTLSGTDSGQYSAGAVCAKAAFWLPQAVAVVVFPRLSDAEAGRAVLRRALLVVAALGAVELVGSAVLGRLAMELTFGNEYGRLAPVVPLFVLQGVALSVLQLLLYRAIATRDPVPVRVLLAALPLETAAVLALQPGRPGPIIGLASAVAMLTAASLLVRSWRS
jgi:O-antigen/teichoic acid export membrane protein